MDMLLLKKYVHFQPLSPFFSDSLVAHENPRAIRRGGGGKVDRPAAVHFATWSHKLNIDAIGQLLELPMDTVRQHFSELPHYVDEIQTMLEKHGFEWKA